MGSSSVTGKGQGSAEGPIRGLEPVAKILKKFSNDVAFKSDDKYVRLDVSDGAGGSVAAEDVVVVPVGNLSSDNAQDAFEEHQDDIDAANIAISENSISLIGKADRVNSPISGDFASLDGVGNIENSGKGPDDYYVKSEIDSLTYDHQFLDNLKGGGGGDYYHLDSAEHLNLTSATPTFDEITLNNAPVDATDAATKGYVDNAVSGADSWLPSVINFSTQAAATETTGFRYIASADGASWTENNVYEWSGSSWTETIVVDGNATYVDDLSSSYLYNGIEWVATGGGISDHNSLNGVQGGLGGGSPERYHLTQAASTFSESVNVTSVSNAQQLIYDSATSKWVNVNPEQIYHVDNDGTVGISYGIFFVDTTIGDVTVTIQDSQASNDGIGSMRIYKDSSDSNSVIVNTVGGQNIGDSTSQIIRNNHEGFSIVSDYNGGVGASWKIVQDNRKVSTSVSQTLVVAAEGGDYTSVEDAINYLNGLTGGEAVSDTNRYVIRVSAGIYTENPFIVPGYVSIMGLNDEASCLQAIDNNSTFITLSDESEIYHLSIDGPTNNVATYSEHESEIIRCSYKNCLTAIQVNGNTSEVTVGNVKFASTCTTGMLSTNLGTIGSSNLTSFASTNSFYSDGGYIVVHNSFVRNCVNAIYANNGGIIHPHLINIVGGTNAVRTGVTGDNIVHGAVISADESCTNHVVQESVTSVINLSSSTFLTTKINMVNASNVRIDYDSDFSGDEGHEFLEELHVGCPELGRETCLGEGDSYTREMLVYTENTELTFTNITDEAASSGGSPFYFPDVLAGNAIYVSSNLQDDSDYKQFLGVKSKVTIAADLGVTGEIVSEYWDGTSWTEFNTLSTDGSAPYLPYAKNLFGRNDSNEQIRFDCFILANWTKNDPPSTGTDRYWMRFRISSSIVTSPTFEQFKVHSNRLEINDDGWMEFMGKARPVDSLPWDAGLFEAANNSPGNQDLYIGDNLAVGRQENLFANGATDRIGMLTPLPLTIDTSCPVKFKWSTFTEDTSQGDIRWVIRWSYTSEGSSVYQTTVQAPTVAENEQEIELIAAAPTVDNIEKWYQVSLDVSDMIARRSGDNFPDTLWLSIERDGGGALDTHSGDVAIVAISAQYSKWCMGGHI